MRLQIRDEVVHDGRSPICQEELEKVLDSSWQAFRPGARTCLELGRLTLDF